MAIATPPRRKGPTLAVSKDRPGEVGLPLVAMMYLHAAVFMAQLKDGQSRPLIVARHHRRWLDLLTRFPRLCWLAPRDHGKSWTLIVYLLWRAWKHNRDADTGRLIAGNPDGILSMLHLTSTLDVSLTLARELQEIVLNNLHVFGDMVPPEVLRADGNRNRSQAERRRRWSARRIRFLNDADLTYKSFRSSSRGLHPQIVVCDDVLDEPNTLTAYQRAKVWTRFMAAVQPMVPPGGQLIVAGTAFHYDDLLHKLRKTPGYEWRKYQSMRTVDGKVIILFPERYDRPRLEHIRSQDPVIFAREYQNDPRDDSSSLFPFALTQIALDNGAGLGFAKTSGPLNERDLAREFVVLSLDFAISEALGADFTVLNVALYDRVTQRRTLLYASREKGLTLPEQVARVRWACRTFGVSMGVVEMNNFQKWAKTEIEKHPETAGRITGHNTGREKQSYKDGVPLLTGILRQELWTIPDGAERKTGRVIDPAAHEYASIWQAEMNAFGWVNDKLEGVGEHDDTVMAFWLLERAIRLLNELLGTPPAEERVEMEDVGLDRVRIGDDLDEQARNAA
jgi:hypothetical protein